MQTPTTDLNTRPALCPFRGPGGGLQHRLRTGLALLMLYMLLLGGGLAYATESEVPEKAAGRPVETAALKDALGLPPEPGSPGAMKPEATSATPASYEQWQFTQNVTDGHLTVTHSLALVYWPATRGFTLYILLQDRDYVSGCVQSTLVTESGTATSPLAYFYGQGTLQFHDSCNPALNYTHPAYDDYYWTITASDTTLTYLHFANGQAYNFHAKQWQPFSDPYLRNFTAARIH